MNKNIVIRLEQLYSDLADVLNDKLVTITSSEYHNNMWVVTMTKPNPLMKCDFMAIRTNNIDNAFTLYKQQIGDIMSGISDRIDLLTEKE